MTGRVHSREFKLSIVRQLASGEKRPAQVCREHQLAESVVCRWQREYREQGEAAFLPKQEEMPSLEARTCTIEYASKFIHRL